MNTLYAVGEPQHPSYIGALRYFDANLNVVILALFLVYNSTQKCKFIFKIYVCFWMFPMDGPFLKDDADQSIAARGVKLHFADS